MEPTVKRRRLSPEVTEDGLSSDIPISMAPPLDSAQASSRASQSSFDSSELASSVSSFLTPESSKPESSLSASDFLSDIRSYIPAGCIRLSQADSRLEPSEWAGCHIWKAFTHPRDQVNRDPGLKLDHNLEFKLFSSPLLAPYYGLHQAGWIRMELKMRDAVWGQVRVYILPDDVGRRTIDRSDRSLRKAMQSLLVSLDTSKDTWNGKWNNDKKTRLVHQVDDNEDELSLFQLFNTLPSPKPDTSVLWDDYDRDAMEAILEGRIEGMRTILLPYQRRTAAMMLQKESEPGQSVDPRLVKPLDQNGIPWYCDISTGTVLREPRIYEGTRGGICAETMGLGKTLICLSLILATRETSSQIPVEYSVGSIPSRPKVGSLLDMSAAAIGRTGTPWKRFFKDAQRTGDEYTNCLDAIKRAVGHYFIPSPPPRRQSRHQVESPPRKVMLTTTTLVVVPINLVRQWEHEIEKHTSGLKVLVMKDPKLALPPAQELCEYDIILFSRTRFEMEAKDGTDSTGRREISSTKRKCYNAWCNASGDCDCLDSDPFYHSPLRDLHFKRLITDEGHTMGNSSDSAKTNAVVVVDFLQLTSRWIISGTPTQGLYGLDVTPAIESSSGLSDSSTTTSSRGTPVPENSSSSSFGSTSLSETFDVEQERKDLEKLGNIAKVYLKARPWTNSYHIDGDIAAWSTYVMQPRHGPTSRGNMACLRNTMENMIIRHRPEDVEADIKLPPLHQKTVFLEPSYLDKLSINMFSLMITSNAVTSERKDADYFFHPSQRKALGNLVANLRQASFFWSGFIRSDIESAIKIANDFLDKGQVFTTDEDKMLLRSAIEIGGKALENQTWLAAAEHHEMPLHVKNEFPEAVRKAWALDGNSSDPTLLGTTQLLTWQRLASKHLADEQKSEQFSTSILEAFEQCGIATLAAAKAALVPIPRRPSKTAKIKKKLENATPALAGGAKVGGEPSVKKKQGLPLLNTSPPKSSKKRSNSIAFGLNVSPTKKSKDDPSSSSPDGNTIHYDLNPILPPSSNRPVTPPPTQPLTTEETAVLLQSARLISTASSKLSYLMTQISLHAPTSKIIVFYESSNTAYYIAQALEILGIEHLIYAKSLSSDRRSRYLQSFNSSPLFRVLLMDITQAAFGLDITAANRVYFVNPVLNRQTEAQAVKRAHRIGQFKPVYVETLVLKHTIEEVILERRREMSSDEQKKVKSVLDDKGMYEWIRNVRFLPMGEGEGQLGSEEQMARLGESVRVFGGKENLAERHPDAGLAEDLIPRKKGKMKEL